MSNKTRLIIVGNGPVGHKLLECIVLSGKSQHFDITIFGEEPRPAYDRVHLTSWFETRQAKSLNMVGETFYRDNSITAYCNKSIVDIDRDKQCVIDRDSIPYLYDKLILATGSSPFVPPIPGHNRQNCFVYRTIEDLQAIAAAAPNAKRGAVVGGGLLGLEAAKALKDLGLDTHIVEFAPRLMAVQIDAGGGDMLRRKIEDLGVNVLTEKNTREIVDGEQHLHKMVFADDQILETDMIVFSAGIRPRDQLAKQAQIDVGPRGGIVIDNHCLTSDKNIYAIGECALWSGRIFGLIAPGNEMARISAAHITDNTDSVFQGADMSTKLKLMGVDVASIGDAHATTCGAKAYTFIDEQAEVYKKIVVSEDNKQLLGAVLVGEAEDYGNLLQFTLNAIELPEHPQSMILPSFSDTVQTGLGVDALPANASICSCNNVSKADLCAAVADGAQTIDALKSCTKAATGCGGCSALVGQILNSELNKSGIEINTDICEHFPYTRRQLYDLIRVEEIKSFEQLIDRHGTGLGCDICKPAVASIMATCWNDHILDRKHTGLQDTNDRFLGNMQKDGTYSVVPRMAGGEVTPDGLIAVGKIAKKYNLYTKITGGQRVDLFGARVEQLPLIWQELIDAGFETGHAYAKSLRTVKSCVGSTWCRYGVQDSTGTAIALENRYKGLRASHKIKMAVSGCTRECAEAQSKDVGVIATEKGWNLYVCGNGGMKPRHADLFATDLDTETLLKTIDRFLMFYVKTADRLQRTASWLENMEGGLDYLRDVIINDSLGICDELETQMQYVVDTYQCEWKTVVETPEKRRLFTPFINAPEASDESITFVQERGQIRPANAQEKHQFTASA